MSYNKKVSIILILLISFTSSAYAGFTISPARIEETVTPGKITKGFIEIKNVGEEPVKLAVNPRYWYLAKENEHIEIDDWLKFKPGEFSLKPDEEKKVLYKIKAPKQAKGMLMTMNAFIPQDEEGKTLTVIQSVPLYVILDGTDIIEGEIASTIIKQGSKNKGSSESSVRFLCVLKNLGNIHLRPQGEINIQDKYGKLIKQLIIEKHRPIFPGSEEFYWADWNDFQLEPGIYTAYFNVDAHKSLKLEKTKRFEVKRNGDIVESQEEL